MFVDREAYQAERSRMNPKLQVQWDSLNNSPKPQEESPTEERGYLEDDSTADEAVSVSTPGS